MNAADKNIDPVKYYALQCARAAIDKKAENVKILNLTELSAFTDYFVICSATSERHALAIAESIEYLLGKDGIEMISMEGTKEARWVLMDFGDVIIHVFLEALREYYDLEGLWADAPRLAVPSEFYAPGASQLN